MTREVNPQDTTRAAAFELWMKAPNPMVTFFKTLDVTNLIRVSKRRGLKFNMLLCWCIGKAAAPIREFYLLPVGEKLMQYDSLAVNTIVRNSLGEVSSCDILFERSPKAARTGICPTRAWSSELRQSSTRSWTARSA